MDNRERAEILTVMNTGNTAFWAMPCGPFSTPRMEAVVTSQKLVKFYQKTWRHITDNRACLHIIYKNSLFGRRRIGGEDINMAHNVRIT
jgi:hypothetical protein